MEMKIGKASGVHESLRPHVESADALYDLLGELQKSALSGLGLRMLACIGCLIVALATSGAVSKAAICLTAFAGMAWVWAMVDFTCREWAMHALSLRDLIRPEPSAAEVLLQALLAGAQEDAGGRVEAASDAGQGVGQGGRSPPVKCRPRRSQSGPARKPSGLPSPTRQLGAPEDKADQRLRP